MGISELGWLPTEATTTIYICFLRAGAVAAVAVAVTSEMGAFGPPMTRQALVNNIHLGSRSIGGYSGAMYGVLVFRYIMYLPPCHWIE